VYTPEQPVFLNSATVIWLVGWLDRISMQKLMGRALALNDIFLEPKNIKNTQKQIKNPQENTQKTTHKHPLNHP